MQQYSGILTKKACRTTLKKVRREIVEQKVRK